MSRFDRSPRRPLRRVRRSLVAAALVAVVLAHAAPTAATPPPGPPNPGGFDNALGSGLYRLDGMDPDLPLGDLAPLRRIVGNARFVGLGEALHTVGSFTDARQRAFRFLVEEMGFRALGIETPWRGTDKLNQYVQTCEGPPEAAFEGTFITFQTEEARSLVVWMCEWNRAHPDDRVGLYGFDVQRAARADGEELLAFLGRLGISAADPRAAGIRACDGVTDVFFPAALIPAERYEECQAALAAVRELFDSEERDIVRLTSKSDLAWARIAATSLETGQEFQFYFGRWDFPRLYAARDRGMAFLAQAIRDQRFPHAKAALWAANGHLGNLSPSFERLEVMGDFMRADLGRDYRVIAIIAHETYANWPAARICGLAPDMISARGVEDLLFATGEPYLLVDLEPRGSHVSILGTEDYSINGSDEAFRLADEFSAILYMEVARAMTSLHGPFCDWLR